MGDSPFKVLWCWHKMQNEYVLKLFRVAGELEASLVVLTTLRKVLYCSLLMSMGPIIRVHTPFRACNGPRLSLLDKAEGNGFSPRSYGWAGGEGGGTIHP
jgi:hypothetical protein